MNLINELKAIQDRHGYLPEEEFQVVVQFGRTPQECHSEPARSKGKESLLGAFYSEILRPEFILSRDEGALE